MKRLFTLFVSSIALLAMTQAATLTPNVNLPRFGITSTSAPSDLVGMQVKYTQFYVDGDIEDTSAVDFWSWTSKSPVDYLATPPVEYAGGAYVAYTLDMWWKGAYDAVLGATPVASQHVSYWEAGDYPVDEWGYAKDLSEYQDRIDFWTASAGAYASSVFSNVTVGIDPSVSYSYFASAPEALWALAPPEGMVLVSLRGESVSTPEAQTYAMIAGLGLLLFVSIRRRVKGQ